MAFPTDWLYRKSITLSRASGAVTNYQMKLFVGESSGAAGEDVDCGALCKTDFSDLRFTASDGTTLLDYWIESVTGTTPNQLATIWIEFNSIGTGATTFYMYYGKSDASAVTNGPNTFILFDHFDAASLDAAKWDTIGAVTVTTQEDGGSAVKLVVTDTTNNAGIKSKSNLSTVAFRGKVKFGTQIYGLVGLINPSPFHVALINFNGAYTSESYIDGSHLQRTGGALDGSAYHTFDIKYLNGTGQTYYEDDSTIATHTTTVLTDTTFRLFLAGYKTTSNPIIYADWLLLRQVLATEPAWGAWGSQENLGISIVPVVFSQYRRRWAA